MRRVLLGGLLMLAAASVAAQPIYRWTDDQGRVQYGAQPPASAKARQVEDRINSYSGPVQVRQAPAATRGSAQPAGIVVMYSTAWCGYCKKARAYFDRNRIRYVEHDVEKSQAAHAEYKRLGGRGVPLIAYEGRLMTGFDERSFEAFVARAGR